MAHRYAPLNGTRWLDLWLITKAKIKKLRLGSSSFWSIKRVDDEDQVLGEQELPPLFYQKLNASDKSTSFSVVIQHLKKLSFFGKKGRSNTIYVEKMDQEIQQMEKMLSKLQTINEVIANHEEADDCILENMINTILNKLQITIIERNVFVKIYADNDISFFSKPRLVYVILENLIENAIYYSSPGTSQSYVEISLKKVADELIIRVEDNGMGIRKEACNKIFNMFYKDSDQSNGGGLGLYIVREAIQKLDGKIGLESKEGCFTKIEAHIPVIEVIEEVSIQYDNHKRGLGDVQRV